MSAGAIVYRGPSQLDGAPIVGVVTGLGSRGSANTKTGSMAQLWILSDAMHPVEAVRRGADKAICGDCPLRPALAAQGAARCYVRKEQGPGAIWRTLQADRYPVRACDEVSDELSQAGRMIRLGAYGDPAALPIGVLEGLTRHVRWTGYTHQWRGFPELRPFCMASVGSDAELREAIVAGWRAYRVRGPEEPLERGEIACPASAEMDHRTTCDACGLCNGKTGEGDRRRNIAIIDHGPTAARKRG